MPTQPPAAKKRSKVLADLAGGTLLSSERRDALEQLCAELKAAWRPEGPREEYLVDHMIFARKQLAQTDQLEDDIWRSEVTLEQKIKALDKLERLREQIQAVYWRADKEFAKLREKNGAAAARVKSDKKPAKTTDVEMPPLDPKITYIM